MQPLHCVYVKHHMFKEAEITHVNIFRYVDNDQRTTSEPMTCSYHLRRKRVSEKRATCSSLRILIQFDIFHSEHLVLWFKHSLQSISIAFILYKTCSVCRNELLMNRGSKHFLVCKWSGVSSHDNSEQWGVPDKEERLSCGKRQSSSENSSVDSMKGGTVSQAAASVTTS